MKCLVDLHFIQHVLMAFAERYILDVWEGSEYPFVIVRAYLKIYQF